MTIEAVVQHGCEIRLLPSQCTEGALRAGIYCWQNQKNLDLAYDWYEGPDLFCPF